MRKRPSAAMAVALVALFVSLAGTAEASFLVSRNSQVAPHIISGAAGPASDNHNLIAGSVDTADLHAGAVTTHQLARGSVTGAKVADGTIGHADMEHGLPCVLTMPGAAASEDAFPACGEVTVQQVSDGVYCITLPYLAFGGAVTLDISSDASSVAFLSFDSVTMVERFGCDSTANAIVTTYNSAGGELAGETFHAIFY
jgi:hypothetical protein